MFKIDGSFAALVHNHHINHTVADISLLLDNLDAGVAYLVAVIAINKKGASPAVYNTVETLQRPELQLIEEKIPHEAEVRSCLSIYLHIYLQGGRVVLS